jgi:hypothetical protein
VKTSYVTYGSRLELQIPAGTMSQILQIAISEYHVEGAEFSSVSVYSDPVALGTHSEGRKDLPHVGCSYVRSSTLQIERGWSRISRWAEWLMQEIIA